MGAQTPMLDVELIARFEREVRRDGRFAPEAFEFLHKALEAAAVSKYGGGGRRRAQHVSGPELCRALRDLAVERWGPLAPAVLRYWNIHETRDFGEMVYLMIDLGIMGKQPSDDIHDFDHVYEFSAAFGSYQIELDRRAG